MPGENQPSSNARSVATNDRIAVASGQALDTAD